MYSQESYENSRKNRRKTDYLVLKHLENTDEPSSYEELVSGIQDIVDRLEDSDVDSPVHYIRTPSRSGLRSRQLAQSLDRCVASEYIEKSDGKYELTEAGSERLCDAWLSHFAISPTFVSALSDATSEAEKEKTRVTSD